MLDLRNVIVSNVLKNENCWRHNDFSETATSAEETNFNRKPTWHDARKRTAC